MLFDYLKWHIFKENDYQWFGRKYSVEHCKMDLSRCICISNIFLKCKYKVPVNVTCYVVEHTQNMCCIRWCSHSIDFFLKKRVIARLVINISAHFCAFALLNKWFKSYRKIDTCFNNRRCSVSLSVQDYRDILVKHEKKTHT